MPFGDIYKLLGLGGYGGGIGGYPPGGTPPFLPPKDPAGTGVPGGTNTPFPIQVGGDPGVDPSGSLVTPEMQAAARRQGLLAFGASLLQSSGPRTGPRIGFGAALGDAVLAGQSANQGSIDNGLQRLLLESKIREAKSGGQDPAKVREYQFAKQNGFTGTYQEFLKIGQGGIGNFNPGDYTPESFAKFQESGNTADLQRYVAPSQPSVQVVNGVPTVVQGSRTGGAPTQQPLTTLGQTVDAGRQIKAGEAEGAATGKATGEALGGITKKGIEATNVLGMLDKADPLIDIATGSGVGSAADSLVGFFGFAPDSAQAAASLKVLESNLVLGLPRLEGPQSDRDAALYKEAAARIGDATVPAPIKKAALQTVREIQQRYKDQFEASGGKAPATKAPAQRKPLAAFGPNGGKP